MNKNDIIDFEKLWDSGNKCRQSVSWKPEVKSFTLNQLERTLAMEKKLKDGTWKNGKPKPIKIYYPKPRDGLSIPYMCKEELHMKDYRRYMDDSLDISINKEKEEQCLQRIINEYKKIGFSVNPNKTHVTPLKDGFYFLGYYWNVTESAKVIMTPDSRSVKHERKKLIRMANKVRRGEMTREKANVCYTSWKSTVQKRKRRRRPYVASPNTYHVIKRMDEYYNNLWEE